MNPLTPSRGDHGEIPRRGAWEFLVLFLVVIIGPPLLERARLPGIIGLLIGGYLIGPNGLDLIGAGNTTVPELGQLGLLYLMFVAGVELDLALLGSTAAPSACSGCSRSRSRWGSAARRVRDALEGGRRASARLADGLAHAAGLSDGPQRWARRPPRRGHRRRGDGDHRYRVARHAGLRVRIAARAADRPRRSRCRWCSVWSCWASSRS